MSIRIKISIPHETEYVWLFDLGLIWVILRTEETECQDQGGRLGVWIPRYQTANVDRSSWGPCASRQPNAINPVLKLLWMDAAVRPAVKSDFESETDRAECPTVLVAGGSDVFISFASDVVVSHSAMEVFSYLCTRLQECR